MFSFFLAANVFAVNRIEIVDNRRVELFQATPTTPKVTIVFENGSRETMDKWDKVIEGIKNEAAIFAYNRPGYGKSDDVETPRDGRTIVEELRRTLKHQGLQPPYVLVGHSLGGLYMQLFARAYPQEVKGIVLVDALPPGLVKKTADFPLWTRIAKRVFLSSVANREIDQIYHTSEEALSLKWNDKIPMVRLINVPKSKDAVGIDFGAFNSDPKVREMINNMYPNAKTIVVDSDHQIQMANPEYVIDAIRTIASDRTSLSAPK